MSGSDDRSSSIGEWLHVFLIHSGASAPPGSGGRPPGQTGGEHGRSGLKNCMAACGGRGGCLFATESPDGLRERNGRTILPHPFGAAGWGLPSLAS